jgi:hypothetical protein
MASCVVSWWMRASTKCGMPTNTTAASEVRARGNHGARCASLSRRHGVEMSSAYAQAYAQRSNSPTKTTTMPTYRWYRARMRCSNGSAISGDGRRRDVLDGWCWAGQRRTSGNGKKRTESFLP